MAQLHSLYSMGKSVIISLKAEDSIRGQWAREKQDAISREAVCGQCHAFKKSHR